MGRHTVPLPQGDKGGSHRTGGEETHLASRLTFGKGRQLIMSNPLPCLCRSQRTALSLSQVGLFSSFQNAVLPFFFLKKNIEKTPKKFI